MRFTPIAIVGTLMAQEAPPPATDQALRKSVESFYGAFVEGKFRKAYALVADDSQDHFLEMGKPEMSAFTIQGISWSEGFQKATVTVAVDTEFRFSGNVVPVKRQLESTWRLENGEWLWYYVPPKQIKTPFGMVTVDPEARKRQVDLKKQIENAPKAEEINRGIEITTGDVHFKKNEPGTGFIEVVNGLSGWIKVDVYGPRTPGLTVERYKPDVGPNHTLRIYLKWEPADAAPERIELQVVTSPVGGTYPVTVIWDN